MAVTTQDRILFLDVLRGLAVLGILAVNAAFFAYAFHAPHNVPPFASTPASQTVIWLTRTFFEAKFITMFSMLFGVSVFLVGGERRDPERSPVLRRRLGWMILFGLMHGIGIWYGDVLLAYALAGMMVMLARSWTPKRLIAVGIILLSPMILLTLAGVVGTMLADPAAVAKDALAFPAYRLGYTGSFIASLTANALDWLNVSTWLVLVHVAFAGPFMLIGMGLFKAGVLRGTASTRLYRRLVAGGALALLATGTFVALQLRYGHFSVLGAAAEAVLTIAAPFITLGYAGLILLSLRRAGAKSLFARILAPVGRMAFTNYITQSVVMTMIFYGGRGLGLFGQLDRPAIFAIVVGVWLAQILISRLWLARFSMGPLEWVWRRLSYGRPVGLRRGALQPA